MKKSRAILLIAAMGAVLAGCGGQSESGTWNTSENSIYVNRAQEIESALVYTSEKDNDTYSQEELKAFAEEAVIGYNTENQAAASAENTSDGAKLPVALESCRLEGKTGSLVFSYAGGDDFVKFAEKTGDNTSTVTSLAAGTVESVLAAGGLADGTFVTKEGKPASLEEIQKQTKYYVVTVEGAATICTEGPVVYTSEGVELRDSYTSITPEGKNYIIFK